jgi:hypothetical protein
VLEGLLRTDGCCVDKHDTAPSVQLFQESQIMEELAEGNK